MKVEKCKWKYGKQAPLVLLMDDLANKYMTNRANGNYIGADWGGKCKEPYSWYSFVYKYLLRDYPYIKMTCFLVVGRREELIKRGKSNWSFPIDYNEEFISFLNELVNDNHFEIAYHGYTHGSLSDEGFIQEWISYKDLDEAIETITKGKMLFQRVTGQTFRGGKYCGYESNNFSDESIVRSDFEYWCRHWDAGVFSKRGNGAENLSIERFDGVVDIPSTVDTHLFSLRKFCFLQPKAYLRAIYYKFRYGIDIEGVIDYLAQNGMVISLQSHTSPIREDNKRQTPNVIDDIVNIRYILDYVKKYDLWYATCAEISDYFNSYEATALQIDSNMVHVRIDTKGISGITKSGCTLRFSDLGDGHDFVLKEKTGEVIQMEKKSDGYYYADVPTDRNRSYRVVRL